MLRWVRFVVILAAVALLLLLLIECNVKDGPVSSLGETSINTEPNSPGVDILAKTLNRKRQKDWYTFEPLSSEVVGTVERFVFFVGYARSGHSIIASMLDAHPNVVIAHEYAIFNKWSEQPELFNKKKELLFNSLYNSSHYSAQAGLRQGVDKKKGYSLEVPGWYQGSYAGGITVIGDKAGGMTAQVYRRSRDDFISAYKQLQETTMTPVHAIHVVRNPFDNIATMVLYNEHVKSLINETVKYNNTEALSRQIKAYFSQVESVVSMIHTVGLDDVTIHHSDFISNPKGTMRHLCNSLYVTCTEHYLNVVAKHTYSSESRSRDLVVWTPELISKVERNMAKFPLLKRYKYR